jgi:glycosyltransferase involved in cell wall biosynthesis
LLTVIFSSLNGEKTLASTLAAFCNVKEPSGGWKLIGVDNGSTDSTAEIMHSFKEKLPLQIISVPIRGKNHALNEALKYTEGNLIVFTDDDTIPDPDWLCHLRSQADNNPEYDLFGGNILPHWPRKPDAWILHHVPLGMVFALSPTHLETGPVNNGYVWGPNMAIRTSIFNSGLKFNTKFGPDGSNTYAMGSESELTTRLAKNNVKSWFCKEAKVLHIIRENQMEKSWILQRFFRNGRSFQLSKNHRATDYPKILGVERWMYKKLVNSYIKIIALKILRKTDQIFIEEQSYYRTKGMIYQSKILSKNT